MYHIVWCVVLFAAVTAQATFLRNHVGHQHLFAGCTNVGSQCAAPNTVCMLTSNRLKRDVLIARDALSVWNDDEDGNNGNAYENDDQPRRQEIIVDNVKRHHHTDVVKNTRPYVKKVYVTRERNIEQPLKKTIVSRTKSQSVRRVEHKPIITKQYKFEKLATIHKPTIDLGTVDIGFRKFPFGKGSRRNDDNNNYNNDNYDNGNNQNAYKLQNRAAALPVASDVATNALQRFKRNAFSAMCMCAKSFVPNAKLSGCQCPHGQTVQQDGVCA